MLRLTNGTTDLVSLITAQNGAKTVAAFTDTTATTWAGSNEVHSITSATTTTIVATPAASTIREIDFINIYNTYAGPQLLTVQLSVSATLYILVAFTLLQGESLQYTHAGGWCALDVNGNRKEVTSSVFSSLTVTGNETVGGTLGVTGTSTLAAVNASGLITPNAGLTVPAGQALTPAQVVGIIGTTTNNNAQAGSVGEYIESIVAGVSATTSGQFKDLTSITLTAGDWELTALATVSANGGTMTTLEMGISATAGNNSSGLVLGSNDTYSNFTMTGNESISVAGYRVSLSAGATYYFKYATAYTVATPVAGGRLSARRMR